MASIKQQTNQMLERYTQTDCLPRVKEPKPIRKYPITTKRNDVIAKLREHFEFVDSITPKSLFK
jgi:hypothetical protein